MDKPQYKIHGFERREIKKALSQLKRYVKNFWHYHQLDKDMASFYGSSKGYPMSDEEAQKKFDSANLRIEEFTDMLSAPYTESITNN